LYTLLSAADWTIVTVFWLLHRLQVIQNAAARLVTGATKYDRMTPVLHSLQWIVYNTAVTAYKCLNGLAPPYLTEYTVSRQHPMLVAVTYNTICQHSPAYHSMDVDKLWRTQFRSSWSRHLESLATRSAGNRHIADHLQKDTENICLTLTCSSAFAASLANLGYMSDTIIIITIIVIFNLTSQILDDNEVYLFFTACICYLLA